tara:strand:+ start:1171 stop:1287 length:117 start_codon:yes stop_codon:yes gene_type:complete
MGVTTTMVVLSALIMVAIAKDDLKKGQTVVTMRIDETD